MSDTEVTFIICKDCAEETEPATIADYKAISVTTETLGNITTGRCKRCNNVVYTLIDHGMVDFGE